MFSGALVFISGLTLAVLTFTTARQALEQAVGRQLTEVAHDVADTISSALLDEQRNMRSLARQDLLRELLIGDLDKNISRFLAALKNEKPAYLDLVCADASGRVVAASNANLVGLDVRERSWFRATQSGRHVLRGPRYSSFHKRRVLEIASPIRRPESRDAVVGSLMLFYDWAETDQLSDHVRENLAALGTQLDIVLLDRHGMVIGGVWENGIDVALGANLRRAGWRTVDKALGSGRRWGFAKEPQADALAGYAPLDDLRFGWRVIVLQPLKEAMAPVDLMQRRWVLVLAAVLAVALAVAAVLANRMIRPLREVTRATSELARRGPPASLVMVSSRDEIGELASAFNAMASDLNRAQEDLMAAAKFAFVGEVAAGIAHEVRTPLGVVRSSAQLLGRTLEPKSKEAELIDIMVAEVDRLERVVAGLLELARPREPVIESTQLAGVLTRATDFIQAQAKAKGIHIRREISDTRARTLCDPEQVYQIALNLLMNSMQVLNPGGTIVVRTLPAATGLVGFEVSDDGPGIPPEIRDRILLPFVTGREGGTGLGLALVDRMVRANRGSIEIESAKGKGATFRIVLRAVEGAA